MTVADRLLQRRRISTVGCWEWTGAVGSSGYGVMWRGGRAEYVHRIAFDIWSGGLVDGLQIDHLCGNTTCFNPAHLDQVTPRVNVLRSTGNSATTTRTGVCQRGHRMTEENTYIRPDGTSRLCRECIRLREARRGPRQSKAEKPPLSDEGLAELRAVVSEGKTRVPKPRMAVAPRAESRLSEVRERADREASDDDNGDDEPDLCGLEACDVGGFCQAPRHCPHATWRNQ